MLDFRLALCLLGFSTQALIGNAAADVLVVTPSSGRNALQLALDAATDGDVILISGAHTAAAGINAKSIALIADGQASITSPDIGLHVRGLGADQEVLIAGIEIEGLARNALLAEAISGRLVLQDSSLLAADGFVIPWPAHGNDGAYVTGVADALFVGCTLEGGAGDGCPGNNPSWGAPSCAVD